MIRDGTFVFFTFSLHRPIVDYMGSIGYSVSKSLVDILKPLIGNSEYHVQNSKDLADCLGTLHIKQNEVLVSHDVVSLFTNTPIQSTLEIVKRRLEEDEELSDRTNLEVSDILELLEFVLTTTYFTFRNEVYKQVFGAAMGSPVSPVVAEFFMEELERMAIATAPLDCKPSLWKR